MKYDYGYNISYESYNTFEIDTRKI